MLLDRAAAVEGGVHHPEPEVEDRQRPNTANTEANAPDGAVVRLVAGGEDDQEDRDREWPAKREREIGHHDEGRPALLGGQVVGGLGC